MGKFIKAKMKLTLAMVEKKQMSNLSKMSENETEEAVCVFLLSQAI